MYDLEATVSNILEGGEASPAEALCALRTAPRGALRDAAHRITLARTPRRFDFCGIVNARSGMCTENCKWCAQSAHWSTGCACHGWIGPRACLEAAKAAEANGVSRFAIVTSGRSQSGDEVKEIADAIDLMREKTRVHICASLGLVGAEDLEILKSAGLERVHCNIETAPSLFPSLCSTHTMREKLATIEAARDLGLEICSGGIIGMGESDEELVEFAFALKAISPSSIPVNVLHPIPGTPLGGKPVLDRERLLDSVSILRLVNPATPLRFAGGRRGMSDETAAEAVRCGMSAGIAGPLLTTPGADYDDDRHIASMAGYDVSPDLRPQAETTETNDPSASRV
ncbi:MAG: biotin synthase BioB [Kiritimatiellae bacterium]|nr:biotin synthase BioB [Kiritimatiellia bacterium]